MLNAIIRLHRCRLCLCDCVIIPSQYGAKKLIPHMMNARTRQNEPSTNSRCTAITRRFRSRGVSDVTVATDNRLPPTSGELVTVVKLVCRSVICIINITVLRRSSFFSKSTKRLRHNKQSLHNIRRTTKSKTTVTIQ